MMTARAIAILVTMALATGGAAWGVHSMTRAAAGAGTDVGLDTDGNGKYDWLVIEAEVALPEAGTWDVYADLWTTSPPAGGSCGPWGRGPPPGPILLASDAYGPIAWAYARYFFPAGTQSVRIAFAGTDIARGGVDGPYRVHAALSLGGMMYREMRPDGPIDADGFVEWTYTTQAYDVDAFEAPVRPAYFTGGHADSAVDVDADGLADFLELRADVKVNLAGTYNLNGFLSKGAAADGVTMVAYAYRDVDLSPSDTSVVLRFRGDQIRRAGLDGPWDFGLTLYGPFVFSYDNGTLRPVDGILPPSPMPYPETLCGTTSAYRAAAFDDTVELLRYTGRFEEVAPDWNGDGTSDVLVVRAEVDVFVTSGFDVSGVLRPPTGTTTIARTAGQAWFSEGHAWAEFAFPGDEIRRQGLDGPYEATLSITPSDRGIDPTTTYTTRAYRASDFDASSDRNAGYWIGDLAAEAGGSGLAISARVVRGNDFLTVVFEDTLAVTVTDASGSVIGVFRDRVYLPSGGSTQFFRYVLDKLAHGTYTVVAVLGSADAPVEERTLTISI